MNFTSYSNEGMRFTEKIQMLSYILHLPVDSMLLQIAIPHDCLLALIKGNCFFVQYYGIFPSHKGQQIEKRLYFMTLSYLLFVCHVLMVRFLSTTSKQQFNELGLFHLYNLSQAWVWISNDMTYLSVGYHYSSMLKLHHCLANKQ